MHDAWYFKAKGKIKGPIDSITMGSMIRQGMVPSNALVWRQGLPKWMTLTEAKAFAATEPAPQSRQPVRPQQPPPSPPFQAEPVVEPSLAIAAPQDKTAVFAGDSCASSVPGAALASPQTDAGKPVAPGTNMERPPVFPRAVSLQAARTANRPPSAEAPGRVRPGRPGPLARNIGLFAAAGALCLLGIGGFLALREKPETSTVVAKPEAVEKAKKPEPPPMSTDPEQKKIWLLAEYDTYERSTPTAFAEKLQRLDKLEELYKEDAWIRAIDQRRKDLRRNINQSAAALVETIRRAALAKMNLHDFKGALAEFDKFPQEYNQTEAQMGLVRAKDEVEKWALAHFTEADQKAQALMQAGRFKEARSAYAGVATYGYAEIDTQLRARYAELADAEKRGLAPSAGQRVNLASGQNYYRSDVYVSLPGMIQSFDAACREAILGETQKALALCDLNAYPRSAVFYYAAGIARARNGKFIEARRAFEQARRLALPGKEFQSRLLSSEAHFALSDIITLGTPHTLYNAYTKALELDSSNAHAYYIQGVYCDLLAQFESADSDKAHALLEDAHKAFSQAAQLDGSYAQLASQHAKDKYAYSGTGGNAHLQSVVQVKGKNNQQHGHGSGFIVQSSGKTSYVITNNHVIDGMTSLSVLYNFEQLGSLVRKETDAVTIVATDKESDLALLKIEAQKELRALPLRLSTGLTVPMKVVLIGHPADAEKTLDFTVVSGELASLNRVENNQRYLQVNANVEHGMSGGPVIDEQGTVVGVTVAKYSIVGQGLVILPERVVDLCEKSHVTLQIRP